jgi:serine/threonine protein kinase/tetratricopeptide (TPR) repeat protein
MLKEPDMAIDFQRVQSVFQEVAELPPAERAAVLERECAGDPELRRRVDALLKAHDDSCELPAVAAEPTGEAFALNEREIFHTALEIVDSADRSAYLEKVCGRDAALKERFENLLELQSKLGSFLEAPAVASVRAVEPGQLFAGRYNLREKLGEGGMGLVFVADQTEPVQRRVALKIIRTGLDTNRVLARFEQERQALALMDHPNIAKVFDAGVDSGVRGQESGVRGQESGVREAIAGRLTPDPCLLTPGRPYFAMELVKGMPLTKYCDDAKLSPRQRLELFIPVCQAVQHAHLKGIIHRDLKPSNILVGLYDSRPVPKVIDFGVAKATGPRLTEQSVYTEVGSIIGTLEYMSPEQAKLNNLDIDTRSDIYALGVILYELLTGSVPISRRELEKAGLAEMLRVIKEMEPPTPSTKLSHSGTLPSIAAQRQTEPRKLTALVRGELDWIVMKALEKDRGRRYETANGFANDIERFLNHEPVTAGPPTVAYRLRKFVRRNRGLVIAASLVLVALVAGAIGTTAGMLEAMRAAAAERQATNDALEKKRLADEAAKQERQAKIREAQRADGEEKARLEAERNLAFARKGNDILASVFAGLDPKRIAESGRPLQDVLRENLGSAVKELEGSAIGDPLEVAAMQNLLGLSLLGLGDYPLAVEVLEKALKSREAKLGRGDRYTLDTMNTLASAYLGVGQLGKAVTLHEETLELRKAKLGPDHPQTLTSMNNLAATYKAAGKLAKALPLHEESLKLHKATLGPDHLHTLTSMQTLAAAYKVAGKINLALPLFEETLKRRKEKLGPNHPHTLITMSSLAGCYHAARRLDLALPLFEEALKLQKAKLGPDHPSTLITMNELALAYHAASKLELALPLYEETFKLMTAKLGPLHRDTLAAMTNLALGYEATGKVEKALPLLQEALRIEKAKFGLEHPGTLSTMNNLAFVYKRLNRLDEAIPLLEVAVETQKKVLGGQHPNTLSSVANLGVAYWAAGRFKDAIPLLEEAYRASSRHPILSRYTVNLQDAYTKTGETAKLADLLQDQLRKARQTLPQGSPQLAGLLAQLGLTLVQQKKPAEAEPLLRECLAIRAKTQPDDWRTFNTQSMLGAALVGQKKYAEAEPLMVKGYEGMRAREEKIPPQGKVRLTEAIDGLIELCAVTNRPDEAKHWRAERAKYPSEKK